ncbi:MAG TPA: hypothetical protein VEW25_06955 [Allosphingosinicella sp.]|nr:hypothetical protein [Allosphingosinicella sp.]
MMPKLRFAALAGLIFALPLVACGDREQKPDPEVIDQHLNRLIAQEEAERRRLVEEARVREDVREEEMEQRESNAGDNAAAPASANGVAPDR